MIVHNLNAFPKAKNYPYGDLSAFEDYELRNIESEGIDEIWYWYAQGNYEGSGNVLMRKGDLFDIHDCGHCSCYGPTDRVDFKGKKLDALKLSLSAEYLSECQELFEMLENVNA